MKEFVSRKLETAITNLPLSTDCRIYLKSLNIVRIKDILAYDWEALKRKKSLNYVRYNEVISYLREEDLLYLMEAG